MSLSNKKSSFTGQIANAKHHAVRAEVPQANGESPRPSIDMMLPTIKSGGRPPLRNLNGESISIATDFTKKILVPMEYFLDPKDFDSLLVPSGVLDVLVFHSMGD